MITGISINGKTHLKCKMKKNNHQCKTLILEIKLDHTLIIGILFSILIIHMERWKKSQLCVCSRGLSLTFICCRIVFPFAFTFTVSSCSHLLFFPCKTMFSKTYLECGWEKEAGTLKGKRLLKCTVSFCLHLTCTLAIYGDSETSSHCLSVGSSHYASLSGEELKLLPRAIFQRNLEMQCLIWLGLIIQSVGVLVGWGM